MTARKNSWIKRMIAAGMAAGLVMSTTLPSLAESVTAEYERQELADRSLGEAVQADQAGAADILANGAENGGTDASPVSSEAAETQRQADDATSAETETDAEEPQEVQLALQLLEVENVDGQSPSLSLVRADELSDKLTVDENAKTIEVRDGEGLILLSNVLPEEYYRGYTIKLVTTLGWDLTQPVSKNGTSYSFLGLGDEAHPYEGGFKLDEQTLAEQYSISTVKPLFNALSAKATLGTIPFCILKDTAATRPLLAENLVKDDESGASLTCNIVLRNLNAEGISEAEIGGLIGTMEAGASASLTFENQFTSDLKVSGENHIGLFCNSMEKDASLTAEFKNSGKGKVSVAATAANADAGGFVGHMAEDTSLTVSGNSVTEVSSDAGNAGGLVGSAQDGRIAPKTADEEGTDSFTFSASLTLTAGSGKAAGGLVGDYTVTKSETISYDLSDYKFDKITISGGENVGGVFGVLNNKADNGKISLSGSSEDGIDAEVTKEVTNFGGLIGSYQADHMVSSLTISGNTSVDMSVASSGGKNATVSYGGMIGMVSGNSYVEIENGAFSTKDMNENKNASFGGLVGKMNDGLLNVGSVTLSTDGNDIAADDVDGRGGLVGHLVKGVLRLHGSTDLSKQKITAAYSYTGQIVGKNENGLVYALGNGNSLTAEGWSLTRYSGSSDDDARSGSDIGNWGAVVRLGDNLTEGDNGAFIFDAAAHTVTINNGTGADIGDTNAFAAYALAFDISAAYTADSALQFKATVNASDMQTVTLTGDVDLTATGILGIGKDSEPSQTFSGTFNGANRMITLDIGSTYGANADITLDTNAAGQLYMKRSDERDAHYSLALIPFAEGATIQNVTIAGTVNGKVPGKVTQADTENDFRYPAFVSAVVGLASGDTTFDGVTVNAGVSVTAETGAKELYVWQSGFLGRYAGEGSLEFKNCTWKSESSLTTERITDHHRIGGLAAEVMGGSTVTVENCTLSGSITTDETKNAYVGGLIAVSRGEIQNGLNNQFTSKSSNLKISNLQVNGEKITAKAAFETSGGLLGYKWRDTEVTFKTDSSTDCGVTVSESTLSAGTARFGGLVYLATGYWNATAQNSIVFTGKASSFSGESTEEEPSGLLIGESFITETVRQEDKNVETVPSALYLEVGTYGSAQDAAYKIDDNAVTLNIGGSEYFDELVGVTKYDDARDRNAVVSIAVRDENGNAVLFDQTENNTYTYQTGKHYKNSRTRYYYNLDAYRKNTGVNFGSVTSAESLVLWSVSQYAANPIKEYFWTSANPTGPNTEDKQTDVTIGGNIDLTGYSYYPVTPLGTVTLDKVELTFDNETIETIEKNNKQPSDPEYQHYLMHHGLLYNTSYSVTVKNVSFSGTVGKEEISGEEPTNLYNSGALIFGTVSGDPTKNPVEINLNDVKLAGIRVIGIGGENPVYYAPLLINKIDRAVKLMVDTLYTAEGYTIGESSNKTTYYAGTSLIGNVGSKEATKLTLSFSNIALDGRLKADDFLSESVWNNGEKEVNYHTTHTIFTRATLLEKFQYVPAEGSGAYNFNSTDEMVTYGVELTNTADRTDGDLPGRNPDKQYEYYDGGYIRDQKDGKQSEEYVKNRYTGSNFIRYVHDQEYSNDNLFELDINQRATGLLEGCGTYGDPYIITDAEQLISLAAYIKDSTTVNDFQVVFNSKVFAEKKQTSSSYHNKDGATSDATGSDVTYKWENGKWLNSENTEQDTETATQYLLNAYYEITTEIKIESTEYAGLGTIDNPFSGVIVGQNQNVVKLSCTGSRLGFGGLIAYSRGSVVRDLTLDYSDTQVIMNNNQYPGIDNNYPFFGGVIGYCMGGDTVIDNVSVSYGNSSISFAGDIAYLISAGGYVGLIGGSVNMKDSDTSARGYEKNGGGVIFRNMGSANNNFTQVCTEAALVNKTVTDEGVEEGNGTYFYRNPYVGRVLDGYACSELFGLENTDKNYTIPTLQAGTNDLQVANEESGSLNVTVNSAQGLWLLSAIVNSGAGAMSSTGTYQDVDNQTVDAYQLGKPRTASYENIGKEARTNTEAYLADEKYWGGVVSTSDSDDAKNRVSYLVKNCTADTKAAHIAGKSSADTNNPVNLTFSGDINMNAYGNGFRGIGSSYGNNMGGWQIDYSIPKVYRRNLLIKSINAESSADTTITLNMNQSDYYDEYKYGSWRNQGAGLFVDFHYTDGCTVNHLKISGTVKAGIFDPNATLTYLDKYVDKEYVSSTGKKYEREEDVGVGGFAARTANSWNKVMFANFHLENLSVYGGTSTGGAIGYVDYPGNNKVSDSMITFGTGTGDKYQPWSISNVKVLEWINNNGSSGGLIGWYESGRMLNIIGYGSGSEEQNIRNLSISTIAQNVNVATAGGLVGALDFGSITVDGVNATEINISGKNLRDVGGLIAGGRQAGSITVNDCILDSISVSSSQNEHTSQGGVGGVLGYHETKVATISGVEIKGSSSISGLRCVGGFVGRSNQKITIENCKESETNISAEWNDAGGFIGIQKNSATIKNGEQSNVNIVAAANAGGLIGNIDGGEGTDIYNMECSEVTTVTKNQNNCAGGLIGWANNKKVNGYNILAEGCKAGYSAKANVNNLSSVELDTTSTCGFWIGESASGGSINLVAVSANGTVYPQIDVGSKSAGTVSIVYADKLADKGYNPTNSADKPSSSANPWLDVNPMSNTPFEDGTVMTGNGVGIAADGTEVARTILKGVNGEEADRYWNLNEEDSTTEDEVVEKPFTQFLDSTNDAYVTTYMAEESTTTTVSEKIDFSILVVNNSAEVDTMLWNYIAAMTNVESGDKAKNQTNSITAKTYKWDSSKGKFVAQKDASLNVSEAKKISIVPNAYDNQSSQFTLLDVTYANPVDAKAEPFHLYIPVLVKKVLYINFKTRFLAGMDYCAADYPMDNDSSSHYATAGFDEPVTAYMEYSYDKDTDWQSMLDNGESLLWYYDKVLDLINNSDTSSGQVLLPKGTQLTLVDRQTQQYYTYTATGSETEDTLHKFNLSKMTGPDGSTPFNPVMICDLLDLTVSDPISSDKTEEGTTYYVVETDPTKATVRKGTTYYRKAQEGDGGEQYRITISGDSAGKARSESYYLTIQVPTTEGCNVVNNRLNYAAFSRKTGTLPATIRSDMKISGSSYLIYNGVEQTFTVATSRVHNGSNMGDTLMENGDSIRIRLESKLQLTEAGIGRFKTLGPSEYYHQFDINLKEYLKGNTQYGIIGTENVEYRYTVTGNEMNVEKTGVIQDAASEETLTIQYGSSDLKKALEDATSADSAVTITAEITLTYALADHFPVRTSDNDDDGISVFGASRIANTASQLPITSTKHSQEDKNRYYIANFSQASLTYNAVNDSGTGDTTQQLGINPIDEKNNLYNIVTRSDYDYSGVDAEVLGKAKLIRYTMELFQKDDSGVYNESSSLTVGDYLQNVSKDGIVSTQTAGAAYQWTEAFDSNEVKHQFAKISFTPLTGADFETAGYMYANYKVRLTAVLLKEDGSEISETKASDYVVYTNARISQEIMSTLQNTAAGNE